MHVVAHVVPIHGGPTQATVTVLVTSTQLLAANSDRKFLFLQNKGSFDVAVMLDGSTAVFADGVLLKADGGNGGGTLTLDASFLPNGAITAIASGGSSNVVVVEF